MKLSVVVPCFNEEANLLRFPDEAVPPLKEACPDLEIIFVDDGSLDRSAVAMSEIHAGPVPVVICRHPRNLGLGAAIKTGLAHATGDAVLTLDADLTFHPKEFPKLLAAFTGDIDCVTGSPIQGKMEGVHPVRHLMSWGVNLMYRVLLGSPVTSVSGIFRLYRAATLKKLTLTCDSFDINAEILFRILAGGGKVAEVPVTLGRRAFGVSKINPAREIKNHFRMFARIMRWRLSG